MIKQTKIVFQKTTKQLKQMKKILVFVSVLMIVCTAQAQQRIEPSAAVSENFGQLFPGATESKWSLKDNVYGVSFRCNEETSIAYFKAEGELIANGRRISERQLPLSVKARFTDVCHAQEKKFGHVGIAALYEFSRDGGTQYVATVENENVSMMLIAENGTVSVSKKTNKLAAGESKSVTARK
jgi:hypothetical protein